MLAVEISAFLAGEWLNTAVLLTSIKPSACLKHRETISNELQTFYEPTSSSVSTI